MATFRGLIGWKQGKETKKEQLVRQKENQEIGGLWSLEEKVFLTFSSTQPCQLALEFKWDKDGKLAIDFGKM